MIELLQVSDFYLRRTWRWYALSALLATMCFGLWQGHPSQDPERRYATAGFLTSRPAPQLAPTKLDSPEVDLGPNDTVICENQVLELDGTPTNLGEITFQPAYLWNTGDTTPTISVDTSEVRFYGCFSVKVYDPANPADSSRIGGDRIFVSVCGDNRKEAAKWYFGGKAGIDFSGGGEPVALTDGEMTNPEGVAVISNHVGRFLFYTDGRTVYTRTNEVMENGTDLNADETASQATIVVPQPADCKSCPERYYIFSLDSAQGERKVYYSVVDMGQGDDALPTPDNPADSLPLGSVVEKNTLLFSGEVTERIAAVENPQDTTYWIVLHEYGSDNFLVYHLTETGLSGPETIAMGSVHDDPVKAQGYMKVSPDGARLAVAYTDSTGTTDSTYGFTGVELFGFDNSSGAVETDSILRINTRQKYPRAAYGVEFANNGNFLFLSVRGPDSSFVYRYTINRFDSLEVAMSEQLIFSSGANHQLGALQIGPDSRIYVAVNDTVALDRIPDPLGPIDGEYYKVGDFDLAGQTSYLGLPNFVNTFVNPPSGPGISYVGTCTGEPIQFSTGAICDPRVDTITWTFPQGTSVQGAETQSASVVWTSPGIYTVQLRLRNGCEDTLLTQRVQIFEQPNTPTINVNAVPCDPIVELTTPANVPGTQYVWGANNAAIASGRTLTIDRSLLSSPTEFVMQVSTGNGSCMEISNPVRLEPFQPVDISLNDTAVCAGKPFTLDAGAGFASYRWERNGVNLNNNMQVITETLNANATYKVTVTNSEGCEGSTSLTVTTQASPVINSISVGASVGCPGTTPATGSISLNVTGASGFSWTGPGSFASNEKDIAGLQAGEYRVQILSAAGCVIDSTIEVRQIEQAPRYQANAPVTASCATGTGRLTLTPVAGPGNSTAVQFDWLNTESGVTTPTTEAHLDGVPGTYTVTLTDLNGCTQTISGLVIRPAPQPVARLTFEETSCQEGILRAGNTGIANPTYQWRLDNTVLSGATGATLTVNKAGNYTLTVRNPDDNSCVDDTTVTVTFEQLNVEVEASTTQACAGDEIELTLRINGVPITTPTTAAGYSYAWRRVGNNQVVGRNFSFTALESGRYEVTVTRDGGGCQTQAQGPPLTFQPIPSADLGDERIYVCQGSSVTLRAPSNPQGTSYNWTLSTNPNQSLGNGPTLEVNQTRTLQTYQLTVTSVNGCSNTGLVDVEVLPQPTVSLNVGSTVSPCANDLTTLVATVGNVPNPTITWFRNNQRLNGVNGLRYTPTQSGRYRVEVEQNACVASAETQVTILPVPQPRPVPLADSSICVPDGETITLDAGPGDFTYRWTPTNQTTRAIEVGQDGVYTVEITNTAGCTETVQYNVVDLCNPRVFVPDAFTPNNDGTNDALALFGAYVVEFEMRVYNRWGEVVFVARSLEDTWDGTYRGQPAPAGTYAWTLTYRAEYYPNRRDYNQNGTILLIR
ncbi:gliding motility-associated C-terminal domain-containing protein [Catalinimonas alkaloidigena]|uniref:Gliding motility-associated C-terminal domain-containing protein n=1 Tax=Catalinimonas alkaloidigena TaxID=1075417 RepID=A0A1G9P908_9BACT|nr:gliding motility-associated C-terminal domain-containing protein [Catalinimonas alkaloidigena]SDL95184.1 gliding motility-associated C-terminal domain-containing protein [Catalinimonas alkaloidigena]